MHKTGPSGIPGRLSLDGIVQSSTEQPHSVARYRLAVVIATWGLAFSLLALTGQQIETLGVKLPALPDVRSRVLFGGIGALLIVISAILWLWDIHCKRKAELLNEVNKHAVSLNTDLASMQQSRSTKILSWLPRDIDDFTGRQDTISHIETLLREGRHSHPRAVAIAAFGGIGGVGKTALAIHLAHRLCEFFPEGQIYINLRGTESVALNPFNVLGDLLTELGVERDAIPDGLEERAIRFRSNVANRRILIVLDNARDEAQVRHLLPGSSSCAVIITSRTRLTSLEGVEQITLDVLKPNQALALLARIVGKGRIEAEIEAARHITKLCGYLPLAVRIAGAKLAAKPHWQLAYLRERLSDEQRRFEEFKIGDLEVRASFALSYRELSEVERKLFRILSVAQIPDFPAWFAGALVDLDIPETTLLLERLVDAHLIEPIIRREEGKPRYRYHDLLRDYARECLREDESETTQRDSLTRALRVYVDLARTAFFLIRPGDPPEFPDWEPGLWTYSATVVASLSSDPFAWFTLEKANLLAAIQQAHDMNLGSIPWELACAIRPFLNWRGQWNDWEHTHLLALAAAERAENLRGQATVLRQLGHAYEEQDRWADAQACFYQSLSYYSQIDDRLGQACALWSIGHTFEAQGKLAEALDCFERCVPTFRELGVRQWLALALNGKARVYRDKGLFERALVNLRECMALLLEIKDHHWHARAISDMGETYLEGGDPQSALDCFERAARVFRQFGDRNREAINLRNIGRAHLEGGRLTEAQKYLEKALIVFEEFDNRHQCAITRHGLTYLQLRRNCTKEAVKQLEKFGSVFREFNDRRWEIRNSVALAEVFLALGRSEQTAIELVNSNRLAVEMGSLLWQARVLRVRITLLTREGQYSEAADTDEKARKMLESLNRANSSGRGDGGTE